MSHKQDRKVSDVLITGIFFALFAVILLSGALLLPDGPLQTFIGYYILPGLFFVWIIILFIRKYTNL